MPINKRISSPLPRLLTLSLFALLPYTSKATKHNQSDLATNVRNFLNYTIETYPPIQEAQKRVDQLEAALASPAVLAGAGALPADVASPAELPEKLAAAKHTLQHLQADFKHRHDCWRSINECIESVRKGNEELRQAQLRNQQEIQRRNQEIEQYRQNMLARSRAAEEERERGLAQMQAQNREREQRMDRQLEEGRQRLQEQAAQAQREYQRATRPGILNWLESWQQPSEARANQQQSPQQAPQLPQAHNNRNRSDANALNRTNANSELPRFAQAEIPIAVLGLNEQRAAHYLQRMHERNALRRLMDQHMDRDHSEYMRELETTIDPLDATEQQRLQDRLRQAQKSVAQVKAPNDHFKRMLELRERESSRQNYNFEQLMAEMNKQRAQATPENARTFYQHHCLLTPDQQKHFEAYALKVDQRQSVINNVQLEIINHERQTHARLHQRKMDELSRRRQERLSVSQEREREDRAELAAIQREAGYPQNIRLEQLHQIILERNIHRNPMQPAPSQPGEPALTPPNSLSSIDSKAILGFGLVTGSLYVIYKCGTKAYHKIIDYYHSWSVKNSEQEPDNQPETDHASTHDHDYKYDTKTTSHA